MNQTMHVDDMTKKLKAGQHGGRGARQGEEASEKGNQGLLIARGRGTFDEITTRTPKHPTTEQGGGGTGGGRGRVSRQRFINVIEQGRHAALQDDNTRTLTSGPDGRLPPTQDIKHTLRKLGLRRGVRLAGRGDGDARRGRGSGGGGPSTVLIAGHLLPVVSRVLPELLQVSSTNTNARLDINTTSRLEQWREAQEYNEVEVQNHKQGRGDICGYNQEKTSHDQYREPRNKISLFVETVGARFHQQGGC